MKRDGTGDSGSRGVDCCEWPALAAEARVMFQAKLLLRTMTESVATQQQRSILVSIAQIAIENIGKSLISQAFRNCAATCAEVTWPGLSLGEVFVLKSWPHLSPEATFRRVGNVTCPSSIVELALVAGIWA